MHHPGKGFSKKKLPPPPASPEERERAQHKAMMAASCAFFAQETLRGPAEAPYNGRFLIGAHHEEWNDLLMTRNRVCVLAPRDHGKTFFFDFAFPLWKAFHQPNGRGYIFSATQDQAVRILSDIKDELEDNPKLAHLVPNPKEQWNATSVHLTNGHRIYARGFGTKVRGAHPNWIVVDDGLNDEDAYSEMIRNKHVEYYFTAITNMIVPTGQIAVVGTPYHGQDLYAEIAKSEEYVFRKYPAVSPEGKPLWPARYNAQTLAARKREIGSVRFTREFLCEPISDDMSLFPERLFRGDPVEQFTVCLGEPMAKWRERGITGVYIGIDLAISTSTGADFMVVFVMGVDRWGNRWVMDIFRKKGMPYQQQISVINAMGKRYDADLIFIEANQMQRLFGDDLIRLTDLPIKKFITTGSGKKSIKFPTGNTVSANKNSLEGGVPALRIKLENQKWRIPRGDARSVADTEQWIQEMKSFAWLNGKLQGVGGHDDTVMACWIADQAVRAGGFSFSTGGEVETGTVDDLLKEQTDEPTRGDDEPSEEDQGRDFMNRMIGADELEARIAADRARGIEPHVTMSANLVDDEAVDAVESAWSRLPGLAGRF